LIKQKLAEMAIRCFVGDALVYRTLGMVDQTLESIDLNDHPRILKAIEQYSVECSIIKVWTSEALAYVVDEMVQIYGGYGFSKEFPAERAYRDARITRIYEGTNEINRLIIATRLLKNAAKGDSNLNEISESILNNQSISVTECQSQQTDYVKRTLENSKQMAILMVATVSQKYGPQFSEEQEVLGLLSDILIDVYAIESVWLRSAKLASRSGEEKDELATDIARVYASDAAERIAVNARKMLTTMAGDDSLWETVKWLDPQRPIDSVAARRRIADAVTESGRYLW
jgi:butyryl-CoA dehydrogenase